MKTAFIALVVSLVVCSASVGWCETKVFQLGFTIPATASFRASQSNTPQSTDQMAQTQQLLRDNKTVVVTSIVAP
jgi:hypothetical protein